MLTLFRGDDLAFAEFDRKVCVRFNTCQDLTGWAAKFCLFDNVKYTADISSRIWTFGYTSEETQVFPLGKTFGKLLILDQCGRIRQMAKVEVEVVNQKLEPCIAGTIAISVDNVVADYRNMGNKPVLNGKIIDGEHNSQYYGLADYESIAQFQGLSDTVQMMSATVADQGEAIANNYVKLVELKEKVDHLTPGGGGDVEEVTQRLNAEIASRITGDDALGARIDAEVTARQEADEQLAQSIMSEKRVLEQAITQEAQAREQAITAIADGSTPISKLLFVAEGDNDNFYRIQVVMRDDGAGGVLPALALDTVPRE